MVLVRIGEKVNIVANPTSWTKKAVVLRRQAHPAQTKALVDAKIAFIEAAMETRGMSGKIGGLPAPAVEIQSRLSGKTHGGKTMAQRREERYLKADGSLKALKAMRSGM